jgi:hypothetical protein
LGEASFAAGFAGSVLASWAVAPVVSKTSKAAIEKNDVRIMEHTCKCIKLKKQTDSPQSAHFF